MRVWIDGILQGGTPDAHEASHRHGAADEITGGEQIEATHNCTATESVGDAVYLLSADQVRQARADAIATMPIEGIIKSKPTSTTCVVVSKGELGGFVGLTADAVYFVSTSVAGGSQATHPTTAGHIAQVIGRAINTTTIRVAVGQPLMM